MNAAAAALAGGFDGDRLGPVALLLLHHVLGEVEGRRGLVVVEVGLDAIARDRGLLLIALLS